MGQLAYVITDNLLTVSQDNVIEKINRYPDIKMKIIIDNEVARSAMIQ